MGVDFGYPAFVGLALLLPAQAPPFQTVERQALGDGAGGRRKFHHGPPY